MLELVLNPVFDGKVNTAQIQGHCGARTWSFCTATEGLRIVNVGVRERVWGQRQTLDIVSQICRQLPLETTDFAEGLKKFDPIVAENVLVETNPVEDHLLIALRMGGRILQNALLPDLCSAMEVLDFYRRGRVLNTADCLRTLQKMLEVGAADTISDKAFHRLSGERVRSLKAEGRYRQAVSAF